MTDGEQPYNLSREGLSPILVEGNLLQKTSPAPNQTGTATQTVSYCCDALHRVTGKGYGAQSCPLSTPVVSYVYDSGTNAIGKLNSLTDQAGTASYSYDVLGRLASETRVIAGVSKSMSYSYNLDGSLKTLTNPSGAMITYTPDSAGRVLSAVDSGNSINYVTGATYGPDSGLTGFISGNSGTFAGITSAFSYNKRLQPVNMSANAPSQTVFYIGYDFHVGNGTSGADNGDVFGITNYKDQNRTQTFTYDALNRLASGWSSATPERIRGARITPLTRGAICRFLPWAARPTAAPLTSVVTRRTGRLV
jgi:YD repeat-containing protein